MCGIAGMIDLTGGKRMAPRAAVARMAQAILHRGPDEDGFLDKPGAHLANRRLSIVGLADGKQPISNEDGTVSTVFNGELYDYPEKRKLLEGRGHTFRTHTDTELIPHLWEEHGAGFWQHLRGQFAICVYDSRTGEFVLGRDRAGICPLFYSVTRIDGADWLLFASEIKALFASGFVSPQADPAGLSQILSFFAMPGPATVFKGVHAILPGRYLHLRPGRESVSVQTHQRIYWEVNYPDQGDEDYGADETKVVDRFEEVLYTAVERRLRADVPVVSYLSGGVDSSLVVAMACKALGRAIPTFTVSVQKKGMNEESEALRTAKFLGCSPIVVPCGDAELRGDYPELIAAAECPVIDTACLGLMHLARSVHQHGYKVAMTGEGADEWLAGYPWFKVARLTKFFEAVPGLGYRVRTAAAKLMGQPPFPRETYDRPEQLFGERNGWLDIYGLMSFSKLRFLTGDMRKAVLAHSPFDDLELPTRLKCWHPFHRGMYLGARVMLAGHLLSSKGDRVAMHSSVEARYPFLDEDVVEFMAKLHPRWKLRGLLRDKFVERKVAQRWLPKDVAWRRKKMFRAPMDSWFGENLTPMPWIEAVLSPESIRKAGYFDPVAVQSARTQLAGMRNRSIGRPALEMGLTAVMATQLWHHLFIRADLCELPSALPQMTALGVAA